MVSEAKVFINYDYKMAAIIYMFVSYSPYNLCM